MSSGVQIIIGNQDTGFIHDNAPIRFVGVTHNNARVDVEKIVEYLDEKSVLYSTMFTAKVNNGDYTIASPRGIATFHDVRKLTREDKRIINYIMTGRKAPGLTGREYITYHPKNNRRNVSYIEEKKIVTKVVPEEKPILYVDKYKAVFYYDYDLDRYRMYLGWASDRGIEMLADASVITDRLGITKISVIMYFEVDRLDYRTYYGLPAIFEFIFNQDLDKVMRFIKENSINAAIKHFCYGADPHNVVGLDMFQGYIVYNSENKFFVGGVTMDADKITYYNVPFREGLYRLTVPRGVEEGIIDCESVKELPRVVKYRKLENWPAKSNAPKLGVVKRFDKKRKQYYWIYDDNVVVLKSNKWFLYRLQENGSEKFDLIDERELSDAMARVLITSGDVDEFKGKLILLS